MEALRYIKKIETGTLVIEDIDVFIGQEAEIIIIPVTVSPLKKTKTASARGIFSQFARSGLVNDEKSAWATAVKEKHGIG